MSPASTPASVIGATPVPRVRSGGKRPRPGIQVGPPEAQSLAQPQPGLESAFSWTGPVVIDDPPDPLPPVLPRELGEQDGVFDGNDLLIVEAVGGPPAQLLGGERALVHPPVERMPVVIALGEQVADALLEDIRGPRVRHSVGAHPSVATSRPRVRIHARAADAGSSSTLVLLRWTYSLVRAESFDNQSAEPASPPTGMWPIAAAPSPPIPRRRSSSSLQKVPSKKMTSAPRRWSRRVSDSSATHGACATRLPEDRSVRMRPTPTPAAAPAGLPR